MKRVGSGASLGAGEPMFAGVAAEAQSGLANWSPGDTRGLAQAILAFIESGSATELPRIWQQRSDEIRSQHSQSLYNVQWQFQGIQVQMIFVHLSITSTNK
ncbi:hypothetical protein PAAG_01635 [Paracoccidioides lutzii Pb01]|uniref:Uncharacterized protein n=1 Tax=Paracoccidioides lutzii (strain ATCC MYA-826 / Pb01) TaxID=502779 RepID=C1GSZ0_PARBA|nr:hypothetical protein PAAG_01635 [Paracoccidioides lutzii Pb01]EEH39173.2 hypothetical protein PAAG_01635 [Paracoccidioides lutzii Pb01]